MRRVKELWAACLLHKERHPALFLFFRFGGALFSLLIRLRHFCYDHGLFPIHHAKLPVISVGNIAVGGTGKTPFVALLTQELEGL